MKQEPGNGSLEMTTQYRCAIDRAYLGEQACVEKLKFGQVDLVAQGRITHELKRLLSAGSARGGITIFVFNSSTARYPNSAAHARPFTCANACTSASTRIGMVT